jgi:ABC-type transport system involved in Fe-S cluster assembly fused permease/ATPase subunit
MSPSSGATSNVSATKRGDTGTNSIGSILRLYRMVADRVVTKGIALSLLLTVAIAVAAGLTPVLFKLLIDRIGSNNSIASAGLGLALGYGLAMFLARATTDVSTLAFSYADVRMQSGVCEQLFAHVLKLPFNFHTGQQSGAFAQILSDGLGGFRTVIIHSVFTFLPILIELVLTAIVMAQLNHPIFIAIVAFSAIAHCVNFVWGASRLGESARAASQSGIECNAIRCDGYTNIEAIKHLSAEAHMAKLHVAALRTEESLWKQFFHRRAVHSLIGALIFGVSFCTSLALATKEAMAGAMLIGDFVLIHTYLLRSSQPFEMVGFAVRDMAQAMARVRALLNVFRERQEEALISTGEAQHRVGIEGDIEFRSVSFGFSRERPVLRELDLTVKAGRTTALVGLSGSGKSTLLRLLVRLLSPSSGTISINDLQIDSVDASHLRRRIAYVPQDPILFNETIGFNIAIARPDCGVEEVLRAARLAHLEEFLAKLPMGLETRVGERGLQLSGGEKQRIAIARAFLKSPQILLMDEATSSLDVLTEKIVLTNLREQLRASTAIIVAHRLSSIVNADTIVVLEGGEIVETGEHSSLLSLNGRYAALWRSQSH